jgi:Uma2 family endonuclease
MTVAEPISRRWTRAEYYRLANEGWFAGQRVQLIRGEIVQMAPQGAPHAIGILRVSNFLASAFGQGHWTRTQMPLNVLDHSDPKPDVAVTLQPAESYSKDHPKTVLLAVEISDSSLHLDRRKAGLYAAAEVPEYWILNLQSRQLEIHRQPVADSSQEFGHRYAEVRELGEDEIIAPLARPDAKTSVKKFFE